MTVPDLGSQRPGDPSETRQMAEQAEHEQTRAAARGPRGWVVIVVAVLVAAALAWSRYG